MLHCIVVDPTFTVTGATGTGGVFGSGYKWYYLKLERNSLYYPLKLEINFSNVPASAMPYHPVQQYNGNGTLYAGLYFFSGMTGMQTASTSYAVGYLNITGTDNSNGNGRVIGCEETSNNINSHSITAVPESHLFFTDIGAIYNGESGITVTYGGSASTQTNDSLSAMRFYYTSANTHSFSGQNEWITSVLINASLPWVDIKPTDENYKGKVVKNRNNYCRNYNKTADIYPISMDAYLRPAFWAECVSPYTIKMNFYLQKAPGTSGGIGMIVRTYTGGTTGNMTLVNTYNVSVSSSQQYIQQELIVYEGRISANVYKVTFAPVRTMTGLISWTPGTSQSLAWSPEQQLVTVTDVGVEKAFTSVGNTNPNLPFGMWVTDFNANMSAS